MELNPVAMVGLRTTSPSPSEASTSSSNHSLDLMRCKQCSVESCEEVLLVSSKRRKGPWMCSYHRNKTYKAKKKQRDQMATSMEMFKKKHEDSLPKPPNLKALLGTDQPPPSDGLPRLDQVLNEKKLALLRSPTIIKFLRDSQQQLSHCRHSDSQQPPSHHHHGDSQQPPSHHHHGDSQQPPSHHHHGDSQQPPSHHHHGDSQWVSVNGKTQVMSRTDNHLHMSPP